MKKLLFILVTLISLQSFGQFKKTFPDANVSIMAPTGFVAEVGKYPVKDKPLGYFIGASTEFGDEASNGFDLSVYAKGQLYLIKNLHATLHVGLVDYFNLQVGVGLRGIIPTKGPDIFIEPILRTGGSVVNIGLRTKL